MISESTDNGRHEYTELEFSNTVPCVRKQMKLEIYNINTRTHTRTHTYRGEVRSHSRTHCCSTLEDQDNTQEQHHTLDKARTRNHSNHHSTVAESPLALLS